MGYFLLTLLVFGCLDATLALGINLQYGYAGIINLAFYAFVAVGAYTQAVTTMGHPPALSGETYIVQWSLPWPIALLLAGLVPAALSLVLISIAGRELRSAYYGIVTIGLAFTSLEVLSDYQGVVNGANGLFNIAPIAGTESLSETGFSLATLGLAAFCLAIFYIAARRIFHSPYGRLLRAIREDEVIPRSFGKKVAEARVSIFVFGCFIAGITGGILAMYIGAWSPSGWQPIETFFYLTAVVIGGIGNYNGAIVASFIVVDGLNEGTRFLTFIPVADIGPVRVLLIGVGLILVLRFLPRGILSEKAGLFYEKRAFHPWRLAYWRSAPNRELEAVDLGAGSSSQPVPGDRRDT